MLPHMFFLLNHISIVSNNLHARYQNPYAISIQQLYFRHLFCFTEIQNTEFTFEILAFISFKCIHLCDVAHRQMDWVKFLTRCQNWVAQHKHVHSFNWSTNTWNFTAQPNQTTTKSLVQCIELFNVYFFLTRVANTKRAMLIICCRTFSHSMQMLWIWGFI